MDGETGTAEVGPYPRAGLHGIPDGCVCALGECAWAVQSWVCAHTRSMQCPCREGVSVGGGVQAQSFKVALLPLPFKLVYPHDCSEERGENVRKV